MRSVYVVDYKEDSKRFAIMQSKRDENWIRYSLSKYLKKIIHVRGTIGCRADLFELPIIVDMFSNNDLVTAINRKSVLPMSARRF